MTISSRARFAIILALEKRGQKVVREVEPQDVARLTRSDLLRQPNCGNKTLAEIEKALAAHGLGLTNEGTSVNL